MSHLGDPHSAALSAHAIPDILNMATTSSSVKKGCLNKALNTPPVAVVGHVSVAAS